MITATYLAPFPIHILILIKRSLHTMTPCRVFTVGTTWTRGDEMPKQASAGSRNQ